jgi:hypothetical protein
MVARRVSLEDNTGSFQKRDLELKHLLTLRPNENRHQKSVSAEVSRDSADVLSPPYTLWYKLWYSQVVVYL